MPSHVTRADLIVHVGNFLGLGESMETKPDGGATLTAINIQLGRRRLVLHQDPNVIFGGRARHAGVFVPSTRITVSAIAAHEQASAVRLVRDLSWLLSLASMSRVVPYQYEYPAGQVAEGWSVPGVCGKSWPLIDIRNGALVRQFAESTFATFRQLKVRRQLPAFIDALISAETGNHPVEISMVTAYLCLEMLKDSWARLNGIPFHQGSFWRPGGRGTSRTKYGFEEMLRDMFGEVGMRPGLKLVTRFRNALIHSGGLRLSRRTKSRAYSTAQRLAREYALRLLGYQGPYVVFGELRPGILK